MVIQCFQYAKELNSTARPVVQNPTVQYDNVYIKEKTSIVNPTFVLQALNQSEIYINYNYVYCASLKRFYFVRDVVAISNDTLELVCECDVLASYRDQILTFSPYVLRSSRKFNSKVIDTYYPALVGAKIKGKVVSLGGTAYTDDSQLVDGCYVLGIVSKNAPGGVDYRIFNRLELANFMLYIFSGVAEWDSITTISGDIAKAFIDPFQYIISCVYLPIKYNAWPLPPEAPSYFGFWNWETHPTVQVRDRKLTYTTAIDAPDIPADRGDWMRLEPFAQYYMINSLTGVIPLDANRCLGGIRITMEIDIPTGEAMVHIIAPSDNTNNAYSIWQGKVKLGIEIPLASISLDSAKLESAVSSLGGAAKTVLSTAVVSGFTGSSIGDVLQGLNSKLSVTGKESGAAASLDNAMSFGFLCVYYSPAAEDTDVGRPLCSHNVLSELLKPDGAPSYVKVEEMNFKNKQATTQECEKVNSFMEGGAFLV